MNELAAEIRRLIRTIADLRDSTKSEWVTWDLVARQQTGSSEAAIYLQAIAELPEWRHLFAFVGRKASLSPAGHDVGLRLRQLLKESRDGQTTEPAGVSIDIGTVHQFQGSEAEAVVFDLVDGPGRRSLGILLRGNEGSRLVNVAVSRAKGKSIILADREWCRKVDITSHNQLLAHIVFEAKPIPQGQQLPRSSARLRASNTKKVRPVSSGMTHSTASRLFCCPHCGHKTEVRSRDRGTMQLCSKCHRFTQVP